VPNVIIEGHVETIKKDLTRKALDSLRDAIKSKTIKVADGHALGATVDGSICAYGFGKSLIGRSLQRKNHFKDKDAIKKLAALRDGRRVRNLRKRKARPTMAQVNLAKKVGITFSKGSNPVAAYEQLKTAFKEKRKLKAISRKGKR